MTAWNTVTVSGGYLPNPDGTARTGSVVFTCPVRLTDAADKLIAPLGQQYVASVVNGAFTIALGCTDSVGISPSGWTWEVVEKLSSGGGTSFPLALPTAGGNLDFSSLPATAAVPSQGTLSLAGYATVARTATGTLTDAAAQLLSLLDKGVVSTAVNVVGDSTGLGVTRWPYLLAQYLASQYPAYTVNVRNWNGGTLDYDLPTRLQTGAAGERCARLDLSQQSYLAIADSTANSIVGDLDLRIKVSADVWASGAEQSLVVKFGGAANRSFRFFLSATAQLQYDWSADGSTLLGPKTCTSFTPPANGVPTWLRVTHKMNNGAAGNDVIFYTSTDGSTWTQAGSVITTAGTTSIFDSTTVLQCGARGDVSSSGAYLTGNVYHVEVRNGIVGPLVAPTRPEWWPLQSYGTGGGATGRVPMAGAPVLDVVNGSQSGADLTTYLNPNVAKMTPDYGTSLVFVSCSHNDAASTGPAYLAQWDSMLTSLRSRLPLASVAVVLQNPRTTPATFVDTHGFRLGQIQYWAAKNKVGWVDVYRAFATDGRALPLVLVNSDGIHPSDAAGSPLWATTIEAELRKRAS